MNIIAPNDYLQGEVRSEHPTWSANGLHVAQLLIASLTMDRRAQTFHAAAMGAAAAVAAAVWPQQLLAAAL
jgi:hypothetical protein